MHERPPPAVFPLPRQQRLDPFCDDLRYGREGREAKLVDQNGSFSLEALMEARGTRLPGQSETGRETRFGPYFTITMAPHLSP